MDIPAQQQLVVGGAHRAHEGRDTPAQNPPADDGSPVIAVPKVAWRLSMFAIGSTYFLTIDYLSIAKHHLTMYCVLSKQREFSIVNKVKISGLLWADGDGFEF